MYGPERLSLRTRHCEAAERGQIEWGTKYPGMGNEDTIEGSKQDLRERIEKSEDMGRIFFGKEHTMMLLDQDLILNTLRRGENSPCPKISSNPTHIPDDILETLTPVLLFRHPLLSIPSIYPKLNPVSGIEPDDEDFEISITLRWTQYIYDYFVSIGRRPIVVEAQDFVWNTKPTMDKLCRELGIDESGWLDKWDPLPKEHWPNHKNAIAMTSDLMESSGLQRRVGEPPELTLDLETEMGKWRERFGDKVAEGFRTRAEEELPIYEYLRSVKLSA